MRERKREGRVTGRQRVLCLPYSVFVSYQDSATSLCEYFNNKTVDFCLHDFYVQGILLDTMIIHLEKL